MAIECAEVSLTGDREDNQDRAAIAAADGAALLVVMDGMGGHAHGARAAEVGCKVMLDLFRAETKPLFDPLGFLHLAIGRAHAAVVAIGTKLAVDVRPRATCAVCLVQRQEAYWAHVGDSRIYHLRNGSVVARTRDHSHVEQLLREGSIREEEMSSHPMRNFVECCLGGESVLPEMTLSRRQPLEDGDVLMVCTDGVWSNLKDTDIAAFLKAPGKANGGWRPALEKLVEQAVAASSPHSDNASAASLVWHH
ncbi:MAG TPA: PP2C family serine/threonine-protein phosphatase [Steroidobacteraceae bacterium]|nr:PP2C family serine/threonine-protein phosphatase [Steroidobacteraceae bacterium]HKX99103.1 PP2C family serine/threonine-protein phosphatase [Steroidobacteraceae bacterium]